MTQFEYNVKPPYPIFKKMRDEYFMLGVCWLLVEDTNKKVNFHEDLLWFDIAYTTGAETKGSIRSYMGHKENFGNHIFSFIVEYNCPLQLTITSPDNFDLSGLKVRTKKRILKSW